jgi:predicted nucleic acid-binding protein
MRLILDSNSVLSALLSPKGAPAQLLDAWERKKVTLIACSELIAELREVAGRRLTGLLCILLGSSIRAGRAGS